MNEQKERLALKPPEFARLAGVSLPTAYAWIHRERDPLPHFRHGRTIIIPRASAEAWLDRQTGQP